MAYTFLFLIWTIPLLISNLLKKISDADVRRHEHDAGLGDYHKPMELSLEGLEQKKLTAKELVDSRVYDSAHFGISG